jgi:hypothetical protein
MRKGEDVDVMSTASLHSIATPLRGGFTAYYTPQHFVDPVDNDVGGNAR